MILWLMNNVYEHFNSQIIWKFLTKGKNVKELYHKIVCAN